MKDHPVQAAIVALWQAGSIGQFVRGDNTKEAAARPDAEPALVMDAKLDQPVKAFAVDQRLEVAADTDVGRGLAIFGVALNSDRQIGAGDGDVFEIGLEGQPLVGATAFGLEIDGDKGGVLDLDADLSTGVTRK